MPSPGPIANSYTVHTQGAPRRRPRTRSQVHCIFRDHGATVCTVFVDGVSQKYDQGSTDGGSGKGVCNNRLVSISILSVSSPIPAKRVSCSKHESSMLASASRRSLWIVSSRLHTRAELLVDVELVLRIICEACGITSMVSTICCCIRSATWTCEASREVVEIMILATLHDS